MTYESLRADLKALLAEMAVESDGWTKSRWWQLARRRRIRRGNLIVTPKERDRYRALLERASAVRDEMVAAEPDWAALLAASSHAHKNPE